MKGACWLYGGHIAAHLLLTVCRGSRQVSKRLLKHECKYPMSPLVLVLVVVLLLSLFGGGYGYRRGNSALAGGGGIVGLLLLVLIIMFLTGRL